MVNINQDEFIRLVEQGLKGSSNGFSLLCKRLVSKLKRNDAELAAKLTALLSGDTIIRGAIKMPPPIDSDSRRVLLQETSPVVLEEAPVWSSKISQRLRTVIREREQADRLISAGLTPIRSLLLSGPPGVGKTLSAHWLANQLNLPLLTLDLATVMSSFLGKTGSNIRSVIEYAQSFPCVLLLDEFDAVAKRRDDDRDVGELKRLVNVLLQAIDEWPSTSLLIAATNHPDILDLAVWRRFDLVLEFDIPPAELIHRYLLKHGTPDALSMRLSPILAGTSFARLKQITTAAKKEAILENTPYDAAFIDQVLSHFDNTKEDDRRTLLVLKHHLIGDSNRKIAKIIGCSHPTVSSILNELGISGGGTK